MTNKNLNIVANVLGDERYWGPFSLDEVVAKSHELATAFNINHNDMFVELVD